MSIREIKRWFRSWRTWRRVRPRVAALRPRLEATFGGPVVCRRSGGRGRDAVCRVLRDGRPVGVLRVVDARAAPSTPAAAGLPFVSLPAARKVAREWRAYALGHPLGLTPEPLWQEDDALLCAYVDARPLGHGAADGGAALALATDALPHLARLHEAGLAHMDMSLSNILLEPATGRHLFVDFEYGPADGLAFEQQCLYDYLRLLESVWKRLPPEARAAAPALWGDEFLAVAPAAVRRADPGPLRPALGRVLGAPELAGFFAALRQGE